MNTIIPFVASEEILQALARLGRTEDLAFSPSNRRLAIAGFNENKILLLGITLDSHSSDKTILLTEHLELTSPALQRPHGLCFIDDTTLIVANREGSVTLFRIPPLGSGQHAYCSPRPEAIIGKDWVRSPGSVATYERCTGIYSLLVCNNYAHYVSRHGLHVVGESIHPLDDEILLSKDLSVPDGVAISHDRRWIAISNHDTHSVYLFTNSPDLNQQSEPAGFLRALDYPHGLCFTRNDEYLLVADAGRPCIHIYAQGSEGWTGSRNPIKSLPVMTSETFLRGHHNPQEGGPKGIAIDSAMQVLVMTSEHQVLTFFDLPSLLEQARTSHQAAHPVQQEIHKMPTHEQTTARRTQACPCGSGKRYKHCCGQVSAPRFNPHASQT